MYSKTLLSPTYKTIVTTMVNILLLKYTTVESYDFLLKITAGNYKNCQAFKVKVF